MRVCLAILFAGGALYAQQPNPHDALGEQTPDRVIGDPQAIARGGELYLNVCSGCHGASGEGGRGPNLVTARNIQRGDDQQLFDVIKKGVPGSDMPPSPLEDEQVWQIAAFIRNLSAPAIRQSVPGDPEAGRAIYEGKGRCSGCHTIRGQGGRLGPDLTNLGALRNVNQIREALLEPSERFAEGFEPVVATLRDGRTIQGAAKNNSNYSLQLLDRDGRLHLLSKKDLSAISFEDESPMPADYAERLSADEITNLLAYLSRLSIRPVAPARPADRSNRR